MGFIIFFIFGLQCSLLAAFPQLPVPSFRLLRFHYRGYPQQTAAHVSATSANKSLSCCGWPQIEEELNEQHLTPPPALSTDGSHSGSSASRMTLTLLKSLPADTVVLGRLRDQWRTLRDPATFPAAFSTLFRDPNFVRRASADGRLLRNTHRLLEGKQGIFRVTWLKTHHHKDASRGGAQLESAVGLWDCSAPVRAPDWTRQHRPVVLLEFWQAVDEECGSRSKLKSDNEKMKTVPHKEPLQHKTNSISRLRKHKNRQAGVLPLRHSKHRKVHKRLRDYRI